jgi:hypothetical protein
MEIKKKDRWMFNTILIHVARTWERVRVAQPFQEMPQDNIESADDSIPTIAEEIFFNDVIQGFLNASEKVQEDDYWDKNTKEGMSDSYIEALAEQKIIENYLHFKLG